MENTIASCIGLDQGKATSYGSTVGREAATGRADTHRTLTTCHVNADGSGYVEVKRRLLGVEGVLHRFDFGKEGSVWGEEPGVPACPTPT